MSESPNGAGETTRVVSFLSAAAAAGKTATAANLAWSLAVSGHRVLLIDSGAGSPYVTDYLRPFSIGHRLAGWETPVSERTTDTSAVRTLEGYDTVQGSGRLDVLPSIVETNSVNGSRARPVARDELAEIRRQKVYDFVVVDGPASPSPRQLSAIARDSDVLVLCFATRPRDAENAAALAASALQAVPTTRVVAVPTQYSVGDESTRRQNDNVVRQAFRAVSDAPVSGSNDSGGLAIVPIPEHHYTAFRDVLTAAAASPAVRETDVAVSDAYRRLAEVVSGRDLSAIPSLPAAVHGAYRYGRGLPTSEDVPRVVIAYVPADRPWAEWVHGQLQYTGIDTFLWSTDTGWPTDERIDGVIVVLPAGGDATPGGRALLSRIRALSGPHVVPLAVPGLIVVPTIPGSAPLLALNDVTDGAVARRALLARFGAWDGAATSDAASPTASRYPGAEVDPNRAWNVPPSVQNFVGRDSDLRQLRESLLDQESELTLVHGRVGVGKSELAREYAYRYHFEYDAVWWIAAQDRQSVRSALIEFAGKAADLVAGDVLGDFLALLNDPERSYRYLLVYDNVDDLDSIRDLIPATGWAHVILTSRRADIPALGHTVEVQPFAITERVEMLRKSVPGLTSADATRVGQAIGGVPLALRLGAGWIGERADRIAVDDSEGTTIHAGIATAVADFLTRLAPTDGEGDSEIRAALDLVLDGLREAILGPLEEAPLGLLAHSLAQMFVYLAVDGVGLSLLRSAPMLSALASAAGERDGKLVLSDGAEIDRVLWKGTRVGLFEVDWGTTASVRMHRVVQTGVERRLGETEETRHRKLVQHALARFSPPDAEVDSRSTAPVFLELQRHLLPSGALQNPDWAVRRWVVNQMRFLYARGDAESWERTLELGAVVQNHQPMREPAADGPEDRPTEGAADRDTVLALRLLVTLGNAHRALGHRTDALRLDEEAVIGLRRALGVRHPRSLAAARNHAADLRDRGQYNLARAQDRATFEGYRAAYGPDHPETLRALGNCALSEYLAGDPMRAKELANELLDRAARVHGKDGHALWFSIITVARYERECGLLDDANRRLKSLPEPDMLRALGRKHSTILLMRRIEAVVNRRRGEFYTAQQIDRETYELYRELLGEQHPNTVACSLSLAIDEACNGFPVAESLARAERCISGFTDALGSGHPFVDVARVDVALLHRVHGTLDEAARLAEEAHGGLLRKLGPGHPWTLAAEINWANTLAGLGDARRATELRGDAYARAHDLLGLHHPYTLAASGPPIPPGRDLVPQRDLDIDISLV